MAKFLWTVVCDELYGQGHAAITSSISAANRAAAHLYLTLGFRLRHPVDAYHRMTT